MTFVIENVRKRNPLIHCITNYVTVNDVANMILAIGATPMMSEELSEVEKIVCVSDGLVINIGTMNQSTMQAMLKAARKAKELNKIVVLDPVAVGLSAFRKNAVKTFMESIHFAAIRGNISEIKALLDFDSSMHGVDASLSDLDLFSNQEELVSFAKMASKQLDTIIVITGCIDIVCDHDRVALIPNGNKEMKRITGMGCMLTGLICACMSANQDNLFEACVVATSALGIAGECAFVKDRTMTYRLNMMDYISGINDEMIRKLGNYEIQ